MELHVVCQTASLLHTLGQSGADALESCQTCHVAPEIECHVLATAILRLVNNGQQAKGGREEDGRACEGKLKCLEEVKVRQAIRTVCLLQREKVKQQKCAETTIVWKDFGTFRHFQTSLRQGTILKFYALTIGRNADDGCRTGAKLRCCFEYVTVDSTILQADC